MKLGFSIPLALCVWLLTAAPSRASSFYYDDFETPLSATYYWVETSDSDPTTPVIGSTWQLVESLPYSVQEVRHPQHLPGDPYPVFNPGLGFSSPPSFAPDPSGGGTQYLHVWGGFNTGGNTSQAWAPISASEQAGITAAGVLQLSTKVFGLSGHDSWRGNVRITGWDNAPTLQTTPVFDLHFIDGGYGTNGTVYYRDGGGNHTITGLVHQVNTWQDLLVNVNFSTDTFSIMLDGVEVTGLPLVGNFSKIQTVSFGPNDIPISSANRGGIDNFTLSIPEPSTTLLLGVGGLVLWRRRARR